MAAGSFGYGGDTIPQPALDREVTGPLTLTQPLVTGDLLAWGICGGGGCRNSPRLEFSGSMIRWNGGSFRGWEAKSITASATIWLDLPVNLMAACFFAAVALGHIPSNQMSEALSLLTLFVVARTFRRRGGNLQSPSVVLIKHKEAFTTILSLVVGLVLLATLLHRTGVIELSDPSRLAASFLAAVFSFTSVFYLSKITRTSRS